MGVPAACAAMTCGPLRRPMPGFTPFPYWAASSATPSPSPACVPVCKSRRLVPIELLLNALLRVPAAQARSRGQGKALGRVARTSGAPPICSASLEITLGGGARIRVLEPVRTARRQSGRYHYRVCPSAGAARLLNSKVLALDHFREYRRAARCKTVVTQVHGG